MHKFMQLILLWFKHFKSDTTLLNILSEQGHDFPGFSV